MSISEEVTVIVNFKFFLANMIVQSKAIHLKAQNYFTVVNNYINPFNPKILLMILLTVCHVSSENLVFDQLIMP